MGTQHENLKDRITEDMKIALRGHDKQRLGAIRLILAAIKQREVDERITLTNDHIISILEKMVKQRKDSIAQFQAAGRAELVEQENFELGVITSYFPSPLTESELDALIAETITGVGATSVKDMGRVMNTLRTRVKGRADMSMISSKVQAKLNS